VLYNVLMILGIFCIVISFIFLNSFSNKEKGFFDEITDMYKDIEKYKDHMEVAIDDLEKIIDFSVDKADKYISDYPVAKKEERNASLTQEDDFFIINHKDEDDLSKKVFELKNIGMDNKEIAQKLNRGIREVEIIIKMNSQLKK